jgi:8-oxo-dGTP pyrophosphatase MutT (NUDIX family)
MPGLNEPYEKLNRSLDARVNQEVARIKVDTSYKAPGLAGYDWSGDTVYIDKRLPTHAGKIPVRQFLIVHEVVEKTLIDRLGYGYKHAHHIALRAERRAVEMAGYDWGEYDRFMQKWIRAIGEEKVPKAEQPPNFEVSSDEKPMHRNAADPLGKTDDGRRVACVGVWDGRRLLLGRRNDNGKWTNPGGHLQPGENPNDGAKRELYEETGLMTDTLVHLGSQKTLDQAGKPLTVYAYMYSGHPDSSTTQMDPDEEVQSWQWVDMKDGVPPMVANDLHVPIERNLLLQKLGLVAMKKSEQLKKSEEKRFSFPVGSEKLREIRDHINKNGGTMRGRDLEKVHNLGSMGLGHLKDGQGNIRADRIQEAIDALPKHEYTVSHDVFGADPTKTPAHPSHPLHEYYKRIYAATAQPGDEIPDPIAKQKHSSEPSKAFQLNFAPDQINALKQAGVHDTFKRMNQMSVQSNHPVRPGNGIGWVRYTEGPDGIFVDEIQSDLAQSYPRQFESQAELAQQVGFMTPEEVDRQRVKMREAFPDDHHEKIKEIAFGDKQPAAVLHDAFHNWLRQNGHAGKPVHMWTTEGKKDAVLSDTDAAAPGHMQFTYTQNPRRMGYEPAKYGELATQNGPHPDKPTQKTIIRKSWLLPFAERMVKNSKPSLMAMLKKADRPNQVEIDHPWEKEGGVPRRVRTADPETARNHELFVDSNLKRTIAKVVPASHRKLFGAMAYYLRRHPTRHVRTVWETPQDKPDGQQVPTMRLRHLKAYMHGDAHIQMQFAPDHILITDHQPHGAASMGKPQWRFSKKGMEFAGYAE